MATNPYLGTVFEASWQSGFDEALAAPDDDHPPPSPLDTDQQTVFAEGVLAGQDEAHGEPQADRERTGWVGVIAELGHTAGEVGLHVAYDLTFVEGATLGLSLATGALMAFAKIAIWGPVRPPFFEEAAAQAVARILDELQSQGATTGGNVELFMAACDQPGHAPSGDDPLSQNGWWHGRVFLDFDAALAEAQAHRQHPEGVRVLRFQSAAPGSVDVIEI